MDHKEAVKHLSLVDPIIGQWIVKIGDCSLKGDERANPFASLVHAIAHQQLSGKAASTILKRFRALFNNRGFPTPRQVLAIEDSLLRSAGFSKAKASYIKGIAEAAISGLIPTAKQIRDISDAQMIQRLTAIKGVGRWSVEMLLIFHLGRPDVLPIHDLGIRKGFKRLYRKRELPTPEQIERHGNKWQPYRTTAAWYLWRAADFLDGELW